MKRYIMTAAVCGCLLIGSLYPGLILEHHVKLVDQNGKEISMEGTKDYDEKIPVKLEFRLAKLFF